MEENNEEVIKTNGETNIEAEASSKTEVKKTNNKSALASFILSLVGLIVAGIPCGIAAFITGILGITKFNAEKEKGKWMAVFGLVLGIIDIIAVICVLPSIYENLGIL